ncbi:hypothetical protein GH733_003980, partial [Mirounga leonina]
DQRAKESTPLPAPPPPPLRPAAKPGFKTFATGRRNYKGGRLPPLSWIWELSAFVAIGFPPPAPASLILGICIPCRATVTPTPVLAGPVGKRKKSLVSCSTRHNGPSNRLHQRQPLRELRSRATGLGGWERASEKEGVGREQRRPTGPLSRDKSLDPALAPKQEVRLRAKGLSCVLGKQWKVAELVPLEKDADYCKTVKCLEPTFLPTPGGCEVTVVVLPVCVEAVWRSSILCPHQEQIP